MGRRCVAPRCGATTTTLSASPTSAPQGTVISLTAIVKDSTGTTTPSGTVTFKDGANVLGTTTLNSTGPGTLSTDALPAGIDAVVAVYLGSSSFGGSLCDLAQ